MIKIYIVVGLFLINGCIQKSNIEKNENTPEHHIEPEELNKIVEAIEIDVQNNNLPPDKKIEKYITNHPEHKDYIDKHKTELKDYIATPFSIEKLSDIVKKLFTYTTGTLYDFSQGYDYNQETEMYKERDLTNYRNYPYFSSTDPNELGILEKYKQAHSDDIVFCDRYKTQIHESWFWQTIEITNYIHSIKKQMIKDLGIKIGTWEFQIQGDKTWQEYLDDNVKKILDKYPYVLYQPVRHTLYWDIENPYKHCIDELVTFFLNKYNINIESVREHITNNFKSLNIINPTLSYLYYKYDSVDPEKQRISCSREYSREYEKINGNKEHDFIYWNVFFGMMSVNNCYLTIDGKNFTLCVKNFNNSWNNYCHQFQKGDKIQILGLNGNCCGHDRNHPTLHDIIVKNITQNKCTVLNVNEYPSLPFEWDEQQNCFIVK